MAAWGQNKNLSTKNGGNGTYMKQLKYDATTDTFIAATAVDVLGEAAESVHILGHQEESTFPRKDDGTYEFDFTIFETDLARLNSLEVLAPVSDAANDDEEVFTEDGQKIGGSSGTYDSTKPVFAFWTRIADNPVNGKKQYRHYIGQFAPAGGLKSQKAKTRNRVAFKVQTIDSKSSPAITIPVVGTFPEFTGVPATALTGSYKHGKYVAAA